MPDLLTVAIWYSYGMVVTFVLIIMMITASIALGGNRLKTEDIIYTVFFTIVWPFCIYVTYSVLKDVKKGHMWWA